jgi:hypothetical protein
MKKLSLTLLFVLVAIVAESKSANAQDCGYPFVPFGFYQPYGAQYSTTIPTPPYFAVNPPVYYGTRYMRPYGISPFAAPPMVTAPSGYQAQPAPQNYSAPKPLSANPYICAGDNTKIETKVTQGEIRLNPFVDQASQLVKVESL